RKGGYASIYGPVWSAKRVKPLGRRELFPLPEEAPMLRRFLVCLAASVVLALGAEPKSSAPLGRKIDDFTLPDAAGKPWSLRTSPDAKAIVVLFLGTECPINNAYVPRLAELHKDYAGKGVQFVAINSNHQDTAER